MTIGTLTCSPQCEFGVMRSYLPQVSFSGVLGVPVITDNVFFFPANLTTLFDYVCIFNPKFFTWGAGRWFLKSIVDEYYYQPPGGGSHSPVDFSLAYVYAAPNKLPSVLNIPFGVSTAPRYFPLPAAAVPYWRNGDDL